MLAIKDNIDVCVESGIRPRLYQKSCSTATVGTQFHQIVMARNRVAFENLSY